MNGQMLIIEYDGKPVTHKFDRPLRLEELRSAVGGDIEVVNGFDSIGNRTCVVFCNEHGKLEGLPVNGHATLLWEVAMKRNGKALLRRFHGVNRQWPYDDGPDEWIDPLVGSIAVVFGDGEFMDEL